MIQNIRCVGPRGCTNHNGAVSIQELATIGGYGHVLLDKVGVGGWRLQVVLNIPKDLLIGDVIPRPVYADPTPLSPGPQALVGLQQRQLFKACRELHLDAHSIVFSEICWHLLANPAFSEPRYHSEAAACRSGHLAPPGDSSQLHRTPDNQARP